MENNKIELSGRIVSDFEYDHEYEGEKFYLLKMKVNRFSGTSDIVSLLVSDRVIDTSIDINNKYVFVYGNIRTYNMSDGEKTHLRISVFVDEIDIIDNIGDDVIDNNSITLNGHICKNNGLRKTPLGRMICDIIVAVNRQYGKSDYIPCIVWGRNATYVDGLDIGTSVNIVGRLQSRNYIKDEIERTAYEVSVQKI